MNVFAGIVDFRKTPISRRSIEAAASVLKCRSGARRPCVQTVYRAVFVQTSAARTLRERVLFAAASRLDNLAEAAAANGVASSPDEAETIFRIFETRGDAGIASLLGAFAIAHWNEVTKTLTLARDCMGQRALFYHAGDGFVAFASNLASLLALPGIPRELDERMVANFLALNHQESETTLYSGIYRVPSRAVVRITPGGIAQHYYWTPNCDASPPFARDEDYFARTRELFERAVARSLRDTRRAAILTSGGMDSSAVAATAAILQSSEICCYTGVPPPDLARIERPGRYLDERPKVEALARRHPSLRTTFIAPRGAHPRQSDPARFFSNEPLPFRNPCNVGWFTRIEDAIAAEGHQVILNGTRGNDTISWDGRWSLSHLMQRWRLPSLITEARAIAGATERSLLRVLAGEALLPLLPAPAGRAVARLLGRSPEDVSAFSLLRPEIVAELDLRREWRRTGYDPRHSVRGSSVRLRAHRIFDQLQSTRDSMSMLGDRTGIERRDPYADRELIEFCLTVPESLYRRGGVPRWFARQVFADRLPPEILNENRTGEQSPNWFESLEACKPVFVCELERFEASRLANRLIDLPRLRRLMAEWPEDAGAAEKRVKEYCYALDRAVHVGQFIRWVEGGNG